MERASKSLLLHKDFCSAGPQCSVDRHRLYRSPHYLISMKVPGKEFQAACLDLSNVPTGTHCTHTLSLVIIIMAWLHTLLHSFSWDGPLQRNISKHSYPWYIYLQETVSLDTLTQALSHQQAHFQRNCDLFFLSSSNEVHTPTVSHKEAFIPSPTFS